MNKFIPQKLYNQILENVPIACVDVAWPLIEGLRKTYPWIKEQVKHL
ncbi:hypothetical protein QUF72_02945 [Desulfobacterales bacterium HSG2]|nr:hypothetical protein [Desulfobacterales bacterium HSG2]